MFSGPEAGDKTPLFSLSFGVFRDPPNPLIQMCSLRPREGRDWPKVTPSPGQSPDLFADWMVLLPSRWGKDISGRGLPCGSGVCV